MEKITHYPVADVKENGVKNDHFRYVPIQNILFDQGMTKKEDEMINMFHVEHKASKHV